MKIWDFVTIICVLIMSISVVAVFDMNNANKIAIVAVEAGLQECLVTSNNSHLGQTVWQKECSK